MYLPYCQCDGCDSCRSGWGETVSGWDKIELTCARSKHTGDYVEGKGELCEKCLDQHEADETERRREEEEES